MSNLGIAILIASLCTASYFYGFKNVACHCKCSLFPSELQRALTRLVVLFATDILPYLVMNHFLVGITFLQHTDPLVPHYSNETWTFAKGALATIDRNSMGFIGPWMFHGIVSPAQHLVFCVLEC